MGWLRTRKGQQTQEYEEKYGSHFSAKSSKRLWPERNAGYTNICKNIVKLRRIKDAVLKTNKCK
jgi:hypothetical protein